MRVHKQRNSKRLCSRVNCNEFQQHDIGDDRYYCSKHYRLYNMRLECKRSKKDRPSWSELEILLYLHAFQMKCVNCHKTMMWHTDVNHRIDLITLQHNNDGTVQFLCFSCNAAHGNSKLGDQYFNLKDNEKYCPMCDRVLHVNKFYRNRTRAKGLDGKCKQCDTNRKKRS